MSAPVATEAAPPPLLVALANAYLDATTAFEASMEAITTAMNEALENGTASPGSRATAIECGTEAQACLRRLADMTGTMMLAADAMVGRDDPRQ